MKIIKNVTDKVMNGKARKMVLVECTKCKKQKEVRADIPQKTDLCTPCASETYGKTNTRIYNAWSNMKARCYNKNNNRYQYYGNKGITVCNTWKDSFQTFYDWAASAGYTDNLTLDRIDPTKGYYPENCRWTTNSVQSANRHYPKGKNTYYGVNTRYTAQIRYKGKTLLSKDCESEEEAAYVREYYILANALPHTRNFPTLNIEEISNLLKKFTK